MTKKSALALIAIGVFCVAMSSKKNEGKSPAALSSTDDNSVWVIRADGSRSCQADTAESLASAESDLKKNGIQILDSTKTHDGKMRAQMCGIASGTMNAYRIHRNDLPKALVQGFREANKDSAPGLYH